MPRVAAILLTMASACGSCGGSQVGTEGPAETAADDEPRLGIVEGVVRLADGAELPSWPEPSGDAARPPMPEGCTPPRASDRQPVRMSGGRGLSNVLVAAAEFEGDAPPHEPVVHHASIRDCRIDPPFIAATRGDSVELSNDTDHPFLPRQGAASFMEMLNHGETRSFELEQGGVTTIDCGFGTGCGKAEVVVLYHPVHTTTGEGGHFRIDNVPPGHSIQIHAWHPLFTESSTHVTVAAGETEQIELVITPAPPPPSPPPTAPPTEDDGADGTTDPPELF